MRRELLAVRCKTGVAIGATRRGCAHYLPPDMGAELVDGRINYVVNRWLCSAKAPGRILLLPSDHRRPMCLHCEDRLHPTVYRCYSASGALIYIGSTSSRTRRVRQHALHAAWWQAVADVTYQEFPTLAEAYWAEQDAIRSEHPSQNRSPGGNSRARAAIT